MALTWTHSWSSSDDGSILNGVDLGNIQSDIDNQIFSIAGWVSCNAYASINAAITAIGSTQTTLIVNEAETLTANLIIPSTLTLKILKGGSIVKASTYTLTINGPFEAGLYQVFSGFSVSDVTFGDGTITEAHPEWWETTDFGAALQSAINSTSKVVISSGTHTFTVANYHPGDSGSPIGVYLKDNLHIVIEKGATVTQATNLNLLVFFAGHMWGTGQTTVLTNVTIEVQGMIDGNYANQTYPATAAYQACPIALFATKSHFPIVRAKNFGRYGALVLYYGPHLDVGFVYAETSYDSTYYQAKALDLETVTHANVGSVIGTALQGAMVDFPDGGSFVNIDSINGKDSYSAIQMVPHAYTLGLHDIQIGKVISKGTLSTGGTFGILIDAYDNRIEPMDISFGQVSISGAYRDGVMIVNAPTTTARARRIQFGSMLLRNNGQYSGGGLHMKDCDDIKIGSLIAYDDQSPKTQSVGISFETNTTNITVMQGDVTGNRDTPLIYGYDPTKHHLVDVVGWKTENSGTSAAIASGATIAHGLVATPTYINITSVDTGLSNIHATVDATNITINFTGGGSHAFYWYARTARNN